MVPLTCIGQKFENLRKNYLKYTKCFQLVLLHNLSFDLVFSDVKMLNIAKILSKKFFNVSLIKNYYFWSFHSGKLLPNYKKRFSKFNIAAKHGHLRS